MSRKHKIGASVFLAALMTGTPAFAGVSADEAAKLGTSLTPMGAERDGNVEGTIPAWTGGMDESTGKLTNFDTSMPNPFPNDKPLFTITAENMAQYADKLTDGVKEQLTKYPDTFHVDVYKTVRSAAFPKFIYDNAKLNATAGSLVNHVPKNVWGGTPFPIPADGEEAIWNASLRFTMPPSQFNQRSYLVTASGQMVLTTIASVDSTNPYFYESEGAGRNDPIFWKLRFNQSGPPIRAGESVVNLFALDSKDDASWVYLTGQRRVRKLPNACCDTTHPASAGVFSYDEIFVWTGRTDRYDWKLLGKKEMYVPYNTNMAFGAPKDADLIKGHHVNPDYVRYELHRVWVVEATLAAGQRHTVPKARFYLDEDSWMPIFGDRWDANGELWHVTYNLPAIYPSVPTLMNQYFGFIDLVSGTQTLNDILNDTPRDKVVFVDKWPPGHFTADSLVADAIR